MHTQLKDRDFFLTRDERQTCDFYKVYKKLWKCSVRLSVKSTEVRPSISRIKPVVVSRANYLFTTVSWNWMSMKNKVLPVSVKALLNIYISILKASGVAFCNSPVSALCITFIKQICIYATGRQSWIKSELTSLLCLDIKFTFLNFHFMLTHEVSFLYFSTSWVMK